MSTPYPFVVSSVINANIVLPITQCTGTAIFTTSSDHFSCRYGASYVAFVFLAATDLSLDMNVNSGATAYVYVDGGTAQTITSAAHGTPVSITAWPNDANPHLVVIELITGVYVDFYNATVAGTGGGFSSSVYGTLPSGAAGYGSVANSAALCTVATGGTGIQSWLDTGSAWGYLPFLGNYVDQIQPQLGTNVNSVYDPSANAGVRFFGTGLSIWIYVRNNIADNVTIVPRVGGTDYAPVTLAASIMGQDWVWVCLGTSATLTNLSATIPQEIVLTIGKYSTSFSMQLAGIMMGGTGGAITTSAITKKGVLVCQGNSILSGQELTLNSALTTQNYDYLLAKQLGLMVCNIAVSGCNETPHFWPGTGWSQNGTDQGGPGSEGVVTRTTTTGALSLPSTGAGTFPFYISEAGTNDLVNFNTSVQIPVNAAAASAIANQTVPSFIATGGNAGGTTITFLQATYAFATANQGQMVTCTAGANVGNSCFITAWASGVLTIEPLGAPTLTWAQVQPGDTFTVNGVNFNDQAMRELVSVLNNPKFSSTKIMRFNLLDRTLSLPVPSQKVGGGDTPAQLSDYRAQIHTLITTLQGTYGHSRIVEVPQIGVITNPSTQQYDGLHPNPTGAALVYANALPFFLPLAIPILSDRNLSGGMQQITGSING